MLTRLLSPDQRGSLENPTTSLSDPDAWLFDTLAGGTRSESGVRVTRKSALKHSAVFRGVNLLSSAVAKMPTLVYRRGVDGGKERDPSHPAYRLLKSRANAEMSAFTAKLVVQAHAIMHGNGYLYVLRNGRGDPVELIPLLPDRTWPVRENGRLLYITTINNTPHHTGASLPFTLGDPPIEEQRKLLPENVIHIKGVGFDGLIGYSLIRFAADAIGAGLAQQVYGAKFFQNSAKPSAVIEVPEELSQAAYNRLKESWTHLQTGLDNAHKAAILEQGAKVNPFSINARDAQLIESEKFNLVVIANFLGLPVHKVGAEGRTSFNSLEQENQSFLDESLDGWLVNWEQELSAKLLSQNQQQSDSHLIEFLRQALIRSDAAKRSAFYRTALAGQPYMRVNEVRDRENLNPVEGGDEIKEPLNMQGGGGSRDAAAQDVLRDAARRACRRLAIHAGKAARDSKQFPDWLARFRGEHEEVLGEMFRPAAALLDGDTPDETADRAATLCCRLLRAALAEVYDTATPAEFRERVEAAAREHEQTFPPLIYSALEGASHAPDQSAESTDR